MNRVKCISLVAGLAVVTAYHAACAQNLLRNGSFEGGMLYWHNLEESDAALRHGDAAVGEYSLRIKKGFAMSAPFVVKRGEAFTVSLFVKAEKPGIVDVSMPPSAREVGQNAGRLWVRGAGQTAHVSTNWQRVSFTWNADVPPDGFWPNPHYLIQIGGGATTLPIDIDGVTVTSGREGTTAYVPRREVEVLAECPDLGGYRKTGNVIAPGATVRVIAHAANAGQEARDVTLRWQLIDYEGEQALSQPIERRVSIPRGKSVSQTVPMPLTVSGCVLARVSAVDAQGSVIDSSDLPLTTLPYLFGPRQPDMRERFGGSFFGLHTTSLGSRLGFAWSRWWPHTKWQDHQPKGPDDWHWFDQELDTLERLGVSAHLVLYGWPKWIMDEGKHPLPRDMRWPAMDPRWEDLSIETAWDRYIKTATAHYQGRAVIYEIENEPEFDHWDKFQAEYAKFTIRTARLIKQVDPKAKVMVNNVYGIPSSLNAVFFKAGGLKYIDVISWHDYHEGWLADATAIKRMRQNLDEAGGQHVEIWFNEGWTYSNTAVDEPIACTHLTSAESANAMVCSVAELTANGQDKTVLFHTAYEDHGMSFWDYSGPGTMLWDWYGYPLPIAAAWNVLAHHIGLSERVGFVRPPGVNFCIFQDQRHQRGIIIAYADRESKADVTVDLPDFGTGLVVEDMMGNSRKPSSKSLNPVLTPLVGNKLLLSKTGRPLFLYAANGSITGSQFAEKLAPLDRKHTSFVTTASAGSGAAIFSLPPAWEGVKKGEPDGSVVLANGRPVWKLLQLWPPDAKKPESFRPMVWTGTDWNVKENGFGGQPCARLQDNTLNLATRAPHGNPPQWRACALSFVAPEAGAYALQGEAVTRIWDGKNKTTLRLLRKTTNTISEVGQVVVEHGQSAPLAGLQVQLSTGDELMLLPQIQGMYAGGDCQLKNFHISLNATGATSSASTLYKLPATWEGISKGSAEGNPVFAAGKPIWRIDRVYPSEHIYAANYTPIPWDGTAWHPEDHQQGGQPRVRVENGTAHIEVAGPWENAEFQKIGGLVFIAPRSGVYQVAANAFAKPWAGNARTFRVAVLKKDTQRAAEVKAFEVPRDGASVPLNFRVELTAGHELVFLPLMPDWHNATAITLENLIVELVP